MRHILCSAFTQIWMAITVCLQPQLKFKGWFTQDWTFTQWFNRPEAILDVYDFLLLDEYNQSYTWQGHV